MNYHELVRENEALRERLSRLSEASLRITGDLEPNAVLQGVVDGARSLTGASTAGLTALDERGQLWEFVTSGLTPEEHRLVVELPGGMEFFAYLSRMPEPLRVADFSAYSSSAGLPDIGPPLESVMRALSQYSASAGPGRNKTRKPPNASRARIEERTGNRVRIRSLRLGQRNAPQPSIVALANFIRICKARDW